MTRGVRTLPPHESIMRAAQEMQDLDVGVIPVCDGDTLVGIVTDRDIVLRAVARGCQVDATPLSDVMTESPCWCFEDESVEDVLEEMRESQIRRVPVVDHAQHLVGILTLGDVAVKADEGTAADALEEISEPARPAKFAGDADSEPDRP
jgi:CBS domain-containing protein